MTKEEFKNWINSAKGDLSDFDNCAQRNDSHKSLYYLQQASEKTPKAGMMAIGFSSVKETEEVSALKKFGIPIKTPIDYGHGWRKVFIRQIDRIRSIPLFVPLIDLFKTQGLKNPQTTVYNAKMVEDIKDPKTSEVEAVLAYSNSLLDTFEGSDFKSKIDQKIAEIRPKITKLAELAKGKIDVDKIINIVVGYIMSMAIVGVLLMLSTLLTPFEQNRFPGEDEKDKPLIPKVGELKKVIERCISGLEASTDFD